MKRFVRRAAVAAGFVAATLASNVALAVVELESNDSIATAQPLTIVEGTTAEVTGSIGATTTSVAVTPDVDFYSFDGAKDSVVNICILNGMKDGGPTNPVRSVDTSIALFGADGTMLYSNDDIDTFDATTDPCSPMTNDARIVSALLPADGHYTVGVSSFPRTFSDQGALATTTVDPRVGNGSYTLTISGVKLPVVTPPSDTPPDTGGTTPPDDGGTTPPPVVGGAQQINIDIRPRHPGVAKIWANSDGKIVVALLSSSSFNAMKVDRNSITFGADGNEASLIRCHGEGIYVNRDRRKDLVCLFDLRKAGFEVGDLEGVVQGTVEGKPFEGHAPLKVVQHGKKRKHQHDFDRWDRHADRR
ncbi:MAG TPA: hypothetical protein VH600_19180 [Burkholderiales bacterium]|jgi:hypothetical protein